MAGQYGACRGCRVQVRWAVHWTTGNRMPLTEDPDNGNVVIDAWGKARNYANHTQALAAMDDPDVGLSETFISHHAVCPERGRFSKTPRAGKAKDVVQEALPI